MPWKNQNRNESCKSTCSMEKEKMQVKIKIKRSFAAILALVMALSLAACGGDKGKGGTDDGDKAETITLGKYTAVGQSSTEGERKRRARQANRIALNPGGQMSAHCPDIRPPEIERELEIEIEKERELEKGHAAPAVLGRYQNVLLSAGELSELQADFPAVWQAYIERLSEYMASTGRTYKSHAATIRRWIADDRRKAAPPARDRDYSVKDGDTV